MRCCRFRFCCCYSDPCTSAGICIHYSFLLTQHKSNHYWMPVACCTGPLCPWPCDLQAPGSCKKPDPCTRFIAESLHLSSSPSPVEAWCWCPHSWCPCWQLLPPRPRPTEEPGDQFAVVQARITCPASALDGPGTGLGQAVALCRDEEAVVMDLRHSIISSSAP